MPVNPNKDQQKAYAYFEQKIYSSGRLIDGMHKGEVLRLILCCFTVTKRS